MPARKAAPNKAKLSTENAGKGVFTDDLMKVEDITNGYCTQFLINKYEGASAAKMRAFAESNGDSVVCIEDDDVINLHVHTADPGKILSEAIKYGYLTNFKIENMHEQFLARQKQGKSLEKQASAEKAPSQSSEFIYAAVDPSRDYGFVAVAAGEGLKAVFTDLSADAVVSRGFVHLPGRRAQRRGAVHHPGHGVQGGRQAQPTDRRGCAARHSSGQHRPQPHLSHGLHRQQVRVPYAGLFPVHLRSQHRSEHHDGRGAEADVYVGEALAYVNSLDCVAVAINQGSFARAYNIGTGNSWRIRIEPFKGF